ncbi:MULTISPECIES: hypothetical protein [unclassified Rathayibacter]|uniref:hypothetical protein n=1 Tax=unclassified Rathayibacter TaxID=2609250 RepID=UPI001FB3A8AE|nr:MULTISPECIES: hypothetical protein [unclassified Rathayibacter]MCJ1674601.1 hypothetical protein [Rathayibacter sp. VKM Ac-2929]MCJ1684882.1 hypothetical protein [Rathayibacter sp. VKM Ac-2928]
MATTTPTRFPPNRLSGAALAGAAAAALVLVPAAPAAAHHGWDGFDTDHLVYIAGTVSSEGSWGEPHSYFDTTLDGELPADTPELTIPEELQGPEDSVRVEAALAYSGSQDELEVTIAPPAYTGRWGLDRPLEIGERFQGVGYIDRTDDALFRPVAFWYGDDDVPVNQVLGDMLPVRAPLPESSGAESTPAPASTSTAADPMEDAEESPGSDAEAASGQNGVATTGVWVAFGAVVLGAAVGGLLYLRRRAGQS